MDIRIGDKLSTPLPAGFKHVGIFAGPLPGFRRAVIHNSKRNGRVVVEEWEEFCEGRCSLEARAKPGKGGAVVERALTYLGRQYNLWKFNCEHFANKVQTGEATSPQLAAGVGIVGVVIALIVWLSKK